MTLKNLYSTLASASLVFGFVLEVFATEPEATETLERPEVIEAAEAVETLEERFGAADQVSLVKVSRVGNLVSPALTYRGMLAVEGALYSVQVLREWKGEGDKRLKIRVDYVDCGRTLRKGREYLVFSRRNDERQLQAYRCEDLVSADMAAELVAQLDGLVGLAVAQQPY